MTRHLFLLSLLLAAAASPVSGQSMSRVVAESAQRSIERNSRNPHSFSMGCPPTTTTLTFGPGQTGTGLDEEIIVMTPCGFNPAGPDLPLIVMFNGFCLGPNSIFNGITQIPDEANARGWLVVAIRKGGQLLQKKSYGVASVHPNVEFVLDYMMQNYPVDEDRIYGAGWSAGGGGIISYGARHLDPSRPMFAAIATNAGTFDMVDVYNNVDQAVQTWLESSLMLGDAPAFALFEYLRSSALLYDPAAMTTDIGVSQMQNLRQTPIYHVYSTDDPITHLPALQVSFASYLLGQGAPITSIPFTGQFSAHSWDLLDPVATLNFFQQHTLDREPSEFEVLCDRDATYYWAKVFQRSLGTFSKLKCSTEPTSNRIEVTMAENVRRLILSPPANEIDPTQNFELLFETADASLTQVLVAGVTQSPTYVLNGTSLFTDWSYDPATSRIVLLLDGASSFDLTVRYDDYSATLDGPQSVSIGSPISLQLGATPNKPFVFFLGLSEGVIPLSLFDPADDRNLLIGVATPPVLLQGALDGAGGAALGFFIPANPAFAGTTLFTQFVTLPGAVTLADEISNRRDVVITP